MATVIGVDVYKRQLLGEHAGLLQQFLFHAARMGMIEV